MENDEQYDLYQPVKNGLLNSDGSVTAFDGTVITSENEEGAEEYKRCKPQVNKFINPDGTIHTLDEISGGGGVNIVQTTGQSTTDVMSQKAVTDNILNSNITSGNRAKINSDSPITAGATNVTLIDSNGTNSIGTGSVAVGGGSYSSSSTNFTAVGYNSKASSNGVAIGSGASASSSGVAIGKSSASTGSSIMIGYQMSELNNSYAIGIGDTNTSAAPSSVAIGHGAKTQSGVIKAGESRYNVALGYSADTNNYYSVALGAYSKVTESSVVSVGDGSGNANYGKRRIINVKDPVNAQDAATKKYVDESTSKIEISQEIGQSTTSVMSQKAVTDAISSSGDVTVDNLKNGYFVTVDTGAKNYISDMVEIPNWHPEMPKTIGMISADGTNGSFYLQTTDGLNYQKYQIQTSGTGYGFKLTYNSDNGKLYAISGQNVFTTYADMPDYWEKQSTTSQHDVSVPAWYSYENGIFFLSAGNQSPTPSGLWKSTNSLNWELISTMKNGWYCCKWLNGAYWACGLGVYKSTDAVTWEQIITPEQLGGSNKWAMNILYADNKYVVMGDWGTKYLTSMDGTDWTEITPSFPRPSSKFLMWDSVNNVFGSVSNNIYYNSSDLENWTNIGSYSSYSSPNSFMISSGKVFIDYGQQYSGKIAVHNTELPFILPESNGGTGTTSISVLKSTMGIPNVVQELGTSTSNVMSQNSINSMIITTGNNLTPLDSRIYSSSYVNSRFASLPHYHTPSELIDDYKKTVLNDSTTGKIYISILNGSIYVFAGGRRVYKSPVSNYGAELNFTNIGTTSSSNASPCGIYYDDTNIYVTTEQQYNQMYVLNQSTGDLTNKTINLTDKWLYCGAYCAGLNLYMVSDHYYFWTSSDNITFTQKSSSQGFESLCSNGTVFVGADRSNLKYSNDGVSWTSITNVGTFNYPNSTVAYSHNKFVYTNGENIWYSQDGITWSYLSNLGTLARTPFSTSYGKCKILANSHPSKYIKFVYYAYGATTCYAFNCETNTWNSLNPIKESVSHFDYIGTSKSDFALTNSSSVYSGTTSYYTNVFTNNFSYKLPAIPSDSSTYTLKAVNGILQWVSG